MERPTLGPREAEVAAQLGKPFQPWQRYVSDVSLEVNPRSGRLVYREVVLVVGRQQGKTAKTLSGQVHRGLAFPQSKIIYTANTRIAALEKWEDEHLKILDASPLRSKYRVRRKTGSEAILWNNGSIHAIRAPTKNIGHGDSTDYVTLDEGWSHEDDECEQGVSPTQITRDQPQLWIPSAVGDHRSVYLRGKVDKGRQRFDLPDTQTAYFEWSAPEDCDPADPNVWWDVLPGLGHVCTEEAIAAEFDRMELPAFCRAYLSMWPDEMPSMEWRVISEADWAAVCDPQSKMVGAPVLAVAVSWDRSWGSIAAAGVSRSGGTHLQLMEHRPGTAWMPELAREIADAEDPPYTVIDPGGPAGSLVPALEDAGLALLKVNAREVGQATGLLLDAVKPESRSVRHLGQNDLSNAVATAMLRPIGDAHTWVRKGTLTSALEAVNLAMWGHALHCAQAGKGWVVGL